MHVQRELDGTTNHSPHGTPPLQPNDPSEVFDAASQGDVADLLQHFEVFKRAFFALQGRCQQVVERIEREKAVTARRQQISQASLTRMRSLGPQTVRLNVGGTHFEVSESLLRQHPGSYFSILLEGEWPLDRDPSGAIFIDRDPVVFRDVLYYLRTGDIPPVPSQPVSLCPTCNAAAGASGTGAGAEAAMASLSSNSGGGATAAAQWERLVLLDFRRLEEDARFYGLTDLSMKLSVDRGVWHKQGEHHLVDGSVPSPRCFAACEYVGNEETLYLFGGCTADDKFFDTLYALRIGDVTRPAFTPSSSSASRIGRPPDVVDCYSWHRVRARYGTTPTARSGHTMSYVAGHLIVVGGNNSATMEPTCHAFNLLAGGWVQLHNQGEQLFPRSGHTVCVVGGQLYLIGGKKIFPAMTTYADVLIGGFDADLGEITWRRAPLNAPIEPRAYHSAVAYEETIFVYGGIESNVYSRDLCRYDTRNGLWTVISNTNTPGYVPQMARSGHVAVLYGREMIVFGSYSEDSTEMTLQALDLTTLVWRMVETRGLAPPRRAAPSGAVIPAIPLRGKMPRLLVFGGFDISARRCFNEVHVITL